MGHDLLLLCRGIITLFSVGEGFAFLLAVRLIWILAVCLPLRQKAVFSLVRWPCFGRVGRSLLAQNLVRWQKNTTLPGNHSLLQRTMAKDFSTMHCNALQIWPVPLPTFSKFKLS